MVHTIFVHSHMKCRIYVYSIFLTTYLQNLETQAVNKVKRHLINVRIQQNSRITAVGHIIML